MTKNNIQDEKILEAKRFININEDARQYFYEKADESWLEWLWNNGFFDVLKEKAEDLNKFSYRTPELQYLVRMADIKPKIVTDIILNTQISENSFNPEVIAQFLHICPHLPGVHLARLTAKIKIERWPALMQNYNQWGMGYKEMFENLEKSGNHKELMELISVVLELRDDWEFRAKEEYLVNTPFCLKQLSYSKVFHYLSNIDEEYIEEAINLSLSILTKMTTIFEEDNETDSVFKRKDRYSLYNIDVFTISQSNKFNDTEQEDIQEVVAAVKILLERVLNHQCKEKAKYIFKLYFEPLPDSWLMWRIRLFFYSLCPSELIKNLKEALFRIFIEDRYTELTMGTEYKKALMKGFPFFSKADQFSFINQAKNLFSNGSNENEKSSKIRDGSRIFSIIGDFLSNKQVEELVRAGFEIDPEYVPTPVIGMIKSGFVQAVGPVTQEELRRISVSMIVQNLKSIWSPAELIKQDIERDFFKPRNAEGMGKLLREDVKTRLSDYLMETNEFIDQDKMDIHYLYSFLSGFTDAIEVNIEFLKNANWEMLIGFCLQVIQIGNSLPIDQHVYEINKNDAWLGGWNAVTSEMINLLKKVLKTNKELGFDWKSHRQNILSLINYFFTCPDPIPEDLQINAAKQTESIGWESPVMSDPYTLAINSIRGQAFELFVLAVKLDTENDDEKVGLSIEIKKLYEFLLNKENTRAIMFMFGYYLPTFFFLDKNWLKSLLCNIFPLEIEKKYQYLAAWEGYLTNNLIIEIFKDDEFQKLYKRAIKKIEKDYPEQKHFTDPNDGIAQHFAFTYIIIDFEFGNELFDYFWTDGSLDQHMKFVDGLGRSFITCQNQEAIDFLGGNENARRKIKNMWNWLLNNYSDSRVFEGIGFWINLDKKIFQPKELSSYLVKTLSKTDGYLNWDVGLQENIVVLAKSSPEDTIEIARMYLLEGCIRNKKNSLHIIFHKEWLEAFQILITQSATNQATISLINDLIQEGGHFFWPLKKVIG